jgi:hypothetical protein
VRTLESRLQVRADLQLAERRRQTGIAEAPALEPDRRDQAEPRGRRLAAVASWRPRISPTLLHRTRRPGRADTMVSVDIVHRAG